LGTELLLFYLFGGVAVAASLLVVLGRNPMHSVLLLIVSFAALAALYITLDSPFAAVIQIIIYAGAIMVLFLFVVMLLNAHKEDDLLSAGSPTMKKPLYTGAVLAVVLAGELVWALVRTGRAQVGLLSGGASPDAAALASVRGLGQLLFTDYAFAFEVTSILIIVAMVGAVVLAKREL
jgi:NADH-quinone oxidoreductase subunit J